MTYATLHRLLARIDITVDKTQILSGSSQAACARHQGWVYKAAPRAQAQDELGRLQLLRDALGSKAHLVVEPRLRLSDEDWWLYALPDLGETSLDSLLEAMAQDPAPFALHARLAPIMAQALKSVACIHQCSRSVQPELSDMFVQELMAAIELNVSLANQRSADVDALLQAAPTFSARIYLSLLHRDLSPINVMVAEVGDTVCFIDSRCAAPNLSTHHVRGSIGFDVAGLHVGVLRREAACIHRGARGSLSPLLMQIDHARADYIQSQALTPALYDLCVVAWWSAYVACRCDFCLAPERLWLYEQAVAQLHQSARKALTVARAVHH